MRPRPINNSWIAASHIARDLPLATLNIKDNVDFAESTKASKSSTEDGRRGMPRRTNHSTQEGTRDTRREQKSQGRTPEGAGDHEIYRPPEAGAQVRILPGAPIPDLRLLLSAPMLFIRFARLVDSIVAGVESTSRATSIFSEACCATSDAEDALLPVARVPTAGQDSGEGPPPPSSTCAGTTSVLRGELRHQPIRLSTASMALPP